MYIVWKVSKGRTFEKQQDMDMSDIDVLESVPDQDTEDSQNVSSDRKLIEAIKKV